MGNSGGGANGDDGARIRRNAAEKDLADLRNAAETLIYGTEQALKEFGATADPAARIDVENKIRVCRRAVEQASLDTARSALAELEQAAQKLFETLH